CAHALSLHDALPILFFSSMRPVAGEARADMDLWMVRRTPWGWGTPEHLGREVNADGYDELYPSVDLLGNLYFARVKAPVPTEDRSEEHTSELQSREK